MSEVNKSAREVNGRDEAGERIRQVPVMIESPAGSPVSKINPLPSADIDKNGHGATNTVFGDKTVGIRKTTIAAQFAYGIQDGDATPEVENGGTITIEEAMLVISSGTDVAGSATIQSTEAVRYVPGQEVYCFFTPVFTAPKENSYQEAGLYDDQNGFFIGFVDTTFTFTRRRDGADYSQTIDLDAFAEKEGYTLDPLKGNIYKISYGYLGFAPILLEVVRPWGGLAKLDIIAYPNSEVVTHTTQTFLPVRGKVANTGNDTDIVLKVGSLAAGIVDGGGEDIAGRRFTWANTTTFNVTGNETLVTFRNKTTFNSIANRVQARLLLISGANSANKTLKWRLYRNPVLEAAPVPVWTDVNTNNSTLEYSINAVADYAASTDLFLGWNTGKEADFFEDVEKLFLDLPPGGMASFAILSVAVGGDADLSIRWSELF